MERGGPGSPHHTNITITKGPINLHKKPHNLSTHSHTDLPQNSPVSYVTSYHKMPRHAKNLETSQNYVAKLIRQKELGIFFYLIRNKTKNKL